MPAHPPSLPASYSRPSRRSGWFMVPFLLILGLATWHLIWRVGNQSAIRRIEAEARAKGEPISIDEIRAGYAPVPEAENAYVTLERLWASEDPVFWKAFREEHRPLPAALKEVHARALPVLGGSEPTSHTNDLSPVAVAAMTDFLTEKAEHLAAVREALKRPVFRAPMRLERGFDMLLPHLAKLKTESQILRIEALAATESGDLARATERIGESVRIGDWLSDDPTLIGQLVRLAIYSNALLAVERLVSRHDLDDALLARLQEMLAAVHTEEGLKRSLLGERAIGFHMFRLTPEGAAKAVNVPATDSSDDAPTESASLSLATAMRTLGWLGLRDADHRLAGETYREILDCVARPDHAADDSMEQIFLRLKDRAKGFPPMIFSGLLLSSLEKADQKFATFEARRRCALAALGIARHRIRHGGSLPVSLTSVDADLIHESTTDPYTGASLRLESRPSGYVVYSLGPNRRDDGGQLERRLKGDSKERPHDVGFRVERLR